MGITKTDFMRGMQCRKMLWLDKHKPKLRIIPPEIQQKLDEGNEFGDRAMSMFVDYEEMTIYRHGTTYPDKKAMAEKTAKHLELGTPVICEAAFIYYNNYCALDILKKTDSGYDIYEVKNASQVRDQFIRDVGFQYYIVRRCKLSIGRIYIVTHGSEEENPFVLNDVTTEAKGYTNWVNDHIWNLNRMQKQAEEVKVEVGDQCFKPYRCWYYEYCHAEE